MEARNRTLPQWFERIRTRQIMLPRFQRMEAWGPREVSDLLRTVLHGLPAGATLVLDVGDSPQFVSRPMLGAPERGERVTELLLDGQQRLTALWRSLTDDYADRRYFVQVPDGEFSFDALEVAGIARWTRNGTRYPVWADSPQRCWERDLVPLSILRPGDDGEREEASWVADASGGDATVAVELTQLTRKLRQRIAEFNLPFLELPVTTPREVALDVFVKLNTRMVRLTAFDVIVAQVEDETGESLHDLVSALSSNVPGLKAYDEPEDVVLSAAALLQDHSPSQAGYFATDLGQMIEEWGLIVEGCRRAVQLLAEESILDEDRLPTVSILAPLVALLGEAPLDGDEAGNARILLRGYIWRACFTDRYQRAVQTATLQDYRALRAVLQKGEPQDRVPCFDEEAHPLPDGRAVIEAAWPKRRDTLARALLALSLRGGAEDIADGTPVSRQSLQHREYHHLFPVGYLREQGVPEDQAARALNCALITWKSNRVVAAKEPLVYLRDRACASALGEDEIRHRLATHAIPYDLLAANDYGKLLEGRAEIAVAAIRDLCEGRAWRPPPAGA